MASTKNYKLVKPGYTSSADINELNNNFDKIDKGLTLDVGTSTGNGNNYILDLGSITLNSDNKGLALRFFADKTANGNAVIVISNINYSLLKTNGKNVKNLKSGSPYIIIFNGSGNFFLASGGGNEDETNITASDVLLNKTFIGQDGEVATGTMPNNGSINANLSANGTCIIPAGYTSGGTISANSLASQTQANAGAGDILSGRNAWVNANLVTGNIPTLTGIRNATGVSRWGDNGLAVYPERGYQKGGSGDGEIKVSQAQLINLYGIIQNKIVSGQQIAGVWGNATVESLGGTKYYTSTFNHTNGRNTEINFPIPFTPTLILLITHDANPGYGAIWTGSTGRYFFILSGDGYPEGRYISFDTSNNGLRLDSSVRGGTYIFQALSIPF